MAKVSLDDILSTYEAVAALNGNFDDIEAALENTLSRDGTAPNQMEANIDMNHNKLVNVGEGTNATDAVNKSQLDGAVAVAISGTVGTLDAQTFSSTILLQAVAGPADQQAAILTEDNKQGLWVFDSGDHTADVAADTGALTYIPPGEDTSGASGAWVKVTSSTASSSGIKTPFDFGAVGDGVTDDGPALQEFFDDAEDPVNAHFYVYDFSMGVWGTNQTIYASREYETPAAEVIRKFKCGTIRVLDTAVLDEITDDTGRANTTVFVVRDYRNHFMGTLFIDGRPYNTATTPPTVIGMRAYSARLFDIGVHVIDCALSTFEDIRVDGAKRDGVRLYNGAFNIRTGTDHEASHGGTSSNNIGASFGKVNVRYSGSYTGTHGWETSMSIDAHTGGANSLAQRTTLTVGDSSELEVNDIVKVRLEIASATFGDITSDATASTLTWGIGDPMAAGLQVGDSISLVDGSGVGVNDVSTFLILGFSGASNRTITVFPAPTTEAAKVYTGINTDWSLHSVKAINTATSISVYPWVPDRSNSVLKSAHGFSFKAIGGNTANVNVDSVLSIVVGGVVGGHGLYNPRIGTVLAEFCEIGVQIGAQNGSLYLGLAIDQIHAEAAVVPILQSGGLAQSVIKCPSALSLSGCRVITPRALTTTGPMPHATFAGLTLLMGNEVLVTNNLGPHEGTHTFSDTDPLSNAPADRGPRVLFITSPTIVVDYDYDVGRLFGAHNWAVVDWYSATGTNPAGTATFNLSTKLTKAGWTIVGISSKAAPATPLRFHVSFDYTNKRVMIYSVALNT